MKKVLAIVLCVAMLACTAVTAFAANSTGLKVELGSVEGKAGDVVAVPVNITAGGDAASISFTVNFDKKLTLVSQDTDNPTDPAYAVVAQGPVARGLMDSNVTDGSITVGWMISTKVTLDGTWFNIYFKIPEDAQAGQTFAVTPIADNASGSDADAKTIPVTVGSAAAVTVAAVPSSVETTTPSDGGSNSTDITASTSTTAGGTTTTTTTTTSNPKTGDTSDVALFAAILCGACALAVVVTKKVHD